MNTFVIVVLVLSLLGIGGLYASAVASAPFTEQRHWQRVAEEARAKQRTYTPVRDASQVRRVERPAEPWRTADDLMDDACDQVDRDMDLLKAGADWMMGQLSRDRRVEP